MRVLALAALTSLLSPALGACSPRAEVQAPDVHPQVLPPFPCQKDSDCAAPACGPCEAGAMLLQQSQSCAVNPCPGVTVGCSTHKICVVK